MPILQMPPDASWQWIAQYDSIVCSHWRRFSMNDDLT